ncbi:metallophosphoesterase family protein [Stieleria varia]|uniref:Bis(5'-nucleosyl)-tetraphosphatase [symmetrical] n=1 Tax=Stieleria varia TaxID=2528005 RepID=A0A5C6ALD9_9BACT|nr:metallophosphoesterase family protein [Stieleria varia]TWU00843.1 Bis(5'-nucleosyl)-tetraphosphatase [symmetrical] [Stieleria varia]
MSRTIAIGDIHGCFDALLRLIDRLNLSGEDKLVFLGDYINRGPDSLSVVRWLRQQTRQRDWICLRGNHEIMFLEEQVGHWHSGQSSDEDLDQADDEKWTSGDVDFLRELLPYHETDQHIFVHACVYGDMPMSEQPEYILHWEPFESMTRPESSKKVICGHTAQKSGVPLQNDFAVCIDTNCCRGGWLTGLDVGSGQFFQTNQDGEVRDGWLDGWL